MSREVDGGYRDGGAPCPKHRARGVNHGCPECDQPYPTAPDAARPAVSVEDVLAAHRVVQVANNAEQTPVACKCGPQWSLDRHRTWEEHLAAALAQAGIGDVAEARDREWDRIVDALAGRANDLHAARADGAQAVVEAVEALDAEAIADEIDARWGTDHAHRLAARRVVDHARAAARVAAAHVTTEPQ